MWPTFQHFTSSLSRVRVYFGDYDEIAEAYQDNIYIDRKAWMARSPFRQMQLLVHETTHTVQYRRLGVLRMHARLTVEKLKYGEEGVYDVSPELERLKKPHQIRITDERFTLESIARKLESFARTVPP